MQLKKIFNLILIVIIIYCFIDNNEYKINKKKIDNIIEKKSELKKYDGYLYIPKYEYRGLIKKGNENEILNSNNILIVKNGSKIKDTYGNIVLAGHNNKFVFSILYKLSINDNVIIFDNNIKYEFIIFEKRIINIKDTYILDNVYNEKIITLITCTKDNQKRLILRGSLKSHNFT